MLGEGGVKGLTGMGFPCVCGAGQSHAQELKEQSDHLALLVVLHIAL